MTTEQDSTFVYGASDDLIELEGAIDDELSLDRDDAHYLFFDNGVVLVAEYGAGGTWTFTVKAGSDKCRKLAVATADETVREHAVYPRAPAYSDVVEVHGATVCGLGHTLARKKA